MKTMTSYDLEYKAQPYQRKDVRFDVKIVGDAGQFEGLASVYDVKDLGGDIVVIGAFTKTLQERGNEVPILWQHDSGQSIGLGIVEETPKGLSIKGQLELDLPEAQSAYVRLKKKMVKGLSIGYRAIPSRTELKDGARLLKEVILYEVSLVTFPMQEMAQVTSVKADEDAAALPPPEQPATDKPTDTRKWAAVTFQNFAIAEDRNRPWDAAGAGERARKWVSATDPAQWTPAQWRKYRSLHLSYDESAPQSLDSYKFLVADVADGQPQYCWAAARCVLKQAWATEGMDAAEKHLAKIYRKFGKDLPAKEQTDLLGKDFDEMYRTVQVHQAIGQTLDALYSCLQDCLYDDDMTNEEKMAESATSIAQFDRAYMAALPGKLDAMAASRRAGPMYLMAQALLEEKIGARNSATDRKRIEDTIKLIQNLKAGLDETETKLQALLTDDAAKEVVPAIKADDDPGTSAADAATQDSIAPDQIHSLLEQLNESFKENII